MNKLKVWLLVSGLVLLLAGFAFAQPISGSGSGGSNGVISTSAAHPNNFFEYAKKILVFELSPGNATPSFNNVFIALGYAQRPSQDGEFELRLLDSQGRVYWSTRFTFDTVEFVDPPGCLSASAAEQAVKCQGGGEKPLHLTSLVIRAPLPENSNASKAVVLLNGKKISEIPLKCVVSPGDCKNYSGKPPGDVIIPQIPVPSVKPPVSLSNASITQSLVAVQKVSQQLLPVSPVTFAVVAVDVNAKPSKTTLIKSSVQTIASVPQPSVSPITAMLVSTPPISGSSDERLRMLMEVFLKLLALQGIHVAPVATPTPFAIISPAPSPSVMPTVIPSATPSAITSITALPVVSSVPSPSVAVKPALINAVAITSNSTLAVATVSPAVKVSSFPLAR